MSDYIAGVDPEVHCSACGQTFLTDPMDAACRLCGAMGTLRGTKKFATVNPDDPYLHTTLHGVKVKVLLDE